ncbi:hypothetical protein EDE15_3851 [Edaphobacter aggregans]|uniref:Uncharacterized protein n=1 Tax=Edaphobacter aggregans TaxID=570835 RepID=A0A428MN13_9BACT|nr:hypothetical protein [Edaphobacter aggregans]RSL18289.1 hypothetical protein EDE15_3851 [Edaphobacter aggregans]
MTKAQIGWITTGAVIGILLAIVAIGQVRADITSGEALPNPFDFLLCWPLILALVLPWSLPRALSYGIMGFLNASTFAMVFLAFGSLLQAIFSATQAIFSRENTRIAGGSND